MVFRSHLLFEVINQSRLFLKNDLCQQHSQLSKTVESDLKRQRSRIVFLWTIVIHNSYYIYCFQLCSQLRLHHHAQTWNMIKVLYSCTFSKLSGSSPGSAKVVSSNCNAPTTAVETVSSSGNYFAVTFFLFFSSEYHFNHRQSRVKHWKRQLKISDDS